MQECSSRGQEVPSYSSSAGHRGGALHKGLHLGGKLNNETFELCVKRLLGGEISPPNCARVCACVQHTCVALGVVISITQPPLLPAPILLTSDLHHPECQGQAPPALLSGLVS